MTEHRFTTPVPLELYVENGSGSVTVTATHPATDDFVSIVEITGHRAEEATVDLRGTELRVIAPQQRGGFLGRGESLHIAILAPGHSSLSARLGSSDLAVTGDLATAEVKSGSGDLTLGNLAEDSILQTGSGDISLADVHAGLRVKSGSGDLRLGRARGEVSVTSGSGDVRVDLNELGLSVKNGSGDVHVIRSTGDVSLTTGSGDLVVDRAARGRVDVKGASGDVRVGVPEGTPVWTDITTLTGDVDSRITGAGEPVEGADHVEVVVRNVSGDVTLAPA